MTNVPVVGEVPPADDDGVRIGVKALIPRSQTVLLVREQRTDGSTFWTLPGGGVAPAETRRAGLRRELAEELDCRVTVGSPLARCGYAHTSLTSVTTVYTVFRTQLITAPSPNPTEGVIDLTWADPASPPEGMLDPFRTVLTRLYEPAGTARARSYE